MLSTREWKPGDVAMVGDDYEQRRAIVRPRHGANGALEFAYTAGGFDMVGGLADGWSARPLVVIDLPNGALAGWPTLIDALRRAREATGLHMIFTGLIEQIEAQTAERKPPEPTGLGAVVEDADGQRWVRFKGRLDDTWAGDESNSRYADIDAVKVLSEGVTP